MAVTSDGGRVEYGRCGECGYIMLPVLQLPPCGHDAPVIRSALTEEGEVYSWTRLRLEDSDLLMVMADFFGGELRVTAPLSDAVSVAIGDSVRLIEGIGTPYAFQLVD